MLDVKEKTKTLKNGSYQISNNIGEDSRSNQTIERLNSHK